MSAHCDTLLFFFLLTACCILSLTPPVRADDAGRFTVLEENDSLFFNSDKHYTQGLRLSDLSPALEPERGWNDVFGLVGGNTPSPPERPGPSRRPIYRAEHLHPKKSVPQAPRSA